MGLFRGRSDEGKKERAKLKAEFMARKMAKKFGTAEGESVPKEYLPQRPGSYGGDVEVIFEQVAQKKEKAEGVWIDAQFPDLFRAEVPGGWIIRARNAMTFVPDPDHSWR